jgi:hypothetical protein
MTHVIEVGDSGLKPLLLRRFEMLTEIQLFVIGTVASAIVWVLKFYKGQLSPGWLTGGVYVVSFVLAWFFAPLALPAFPPFVDLASFVPALLGWVGDLLIPLSAFVGFATLVYNVLLKSVLDNYVKPFLARFKK